MTKKEELLETIAASLIPLLQAMDTLTWARQRFEPYGIDLIVNAIRDNPETLEAALANQNCSRDQRLDVPYRTCPPGKRMFSC
jgi:hypothetical protein